MDYYNIFRSFIYNDGRGSIPAGQNQNGGHNISIFISWITVATRLEPPDMDMDIPFPWHQDLVA